jgi:hypothetical protein
MDKHGGAIGFDMFVQADADGGLGENRGERGLADLKRLATKIVAVQFYEIEGIEEDAAVVAAITNSIKVRHALVVAAHGLAVDNARA